MSDNFLSAEKPKSETDSGWIEYALLLGWEELPVGYEYVTDNATDELATLRAQLAEAREVIKPFIHEDLCSQLAGNTIGEKSIVFGRDKAELTLGDFRAARAWYNKVITA